MKRIHTGGGRVLAAAFGAIARYVQGAGGTEARSTIITCDFHRSMSKLQHRNVMFAVVLA